MIFCCWHTQHWRSSCLWHWPYPTSSFKVYGETARSNHTCFLGICTPPHQSKPASHFQYHLSWTHDLWNADQLPSSSPYKNRHVCCKSLLDSDDEFDTNKVASSSFQGVYMLSFVSFPALGMNFKGGSSQVWMRIFKHEVMRCWLPV